MLMNLLPGLRDLRAPLAAGYLWLVGLWLLLADAVAPRTTATGVLAHVYVLTTALGRGTVLAAISFVAYLIGTVLSVDADGPLVAFFTSLPYFFRWLFSRRRSGGDPDSLRPMVDLVKRAMRGRLSTKVSNDIVARVIRLQENALANISPTPNKAYQNMTDAEQEVLRQAFREWGDTDPEVIYGRVDSSGYIWVMDVWKSLAIVMASNLVREVRQLVTELRVTQPALFDQYDRARGEAEFRVSVAFPLTFIAVVLAFKWTPLWLLLLLAVVLIMRSGLRRARDATDVIAQAALAGYVTPNGWASPKADPRTLAKQALDAYTPHVMESAGEPENQEIVRNMRRYLESDQTTPVAE
jgi:hypothetical protein